MQTLVSTFFDQVQRLGHRQVALREKRGGQWRASTWGDYGEAVSRAAEGLRALGVSPGDRVAILSANRPEWLHTDLGAMCLSAAGVGLYPTELPDNLHHIVAHCGAAVLVVDTPAQLARTDGWRDAVDSLRTVVLLEPGDTPLQGKVTSWEAMLEGGRAAWEADPGRVEREARAIPDDTLAMLVYTSGTTGPSKGAMYSHANLVYEGAVLRDVLAGDAGLTTLSYLPLCHIAERLQAEIVALPAAATVSFAESLDKLRDNLVEVRPTVMLAVPRVWEKFYAAIKARFDEATGLRGLLVRATRSVGAEVAARRNRGEPLPPALALRWAVLRRLVVSKLKAGLGLDRVHLFVSGAAPLAQEIAEFFGSLEMDIHEVYGQTECVGVCTVNPFGRVRFGSVGRPIDGCEVVLAEDGEVLVRGPNVFLGYLRAEEATAGAVDTDGWLHTGDVGELDDEGYLRITDRKKDIIVTAGGKNVAPQDIESRLKTFAGVSQVVVIGDRRPYLVALVALDPAADPPPSEAQVQGYVDAVNERLHRYAQLKHFRLLPRELTVEDGEMTPTLKVKRRAVQERYAPEIDGLYRAGAE